MHKFILKRVRFKFPTQNSNLARQCKSGSHDGTALRTITSTPRDYSTGSPRQL
jgi:hypothetical protein